MAEVFDEVADSVIASHRTASRNAKGNLAVTVKDKKTVRAMTSNGRIVVKLERDRVTELVSSGIGTHYKDQINEWLELSPDLPISTYGTLIVEAVER